MAAHSEGETLTAMITDSKNKFVVTSDSAGYIKVNKRNVTFFRGLDVIFQGYFTR